MTATLLKPRALPKDLHNLAKEVQHVEAIVHACVRLKHPNVALSALTKMFPNFYWAIISSKKHPHYRHVDVIKNRLHIKFKYDFPQESVHLIATNIRVIRTR